MKTSEQIVFTEKQVKIIDAMRDDTKTIQQLKALTGVGFSTIRILLERLEAFNLLDIYFDNNRKYHGLLDKVMDIKQNEKGKYIYIKTYIGE